MQAFGRIKRLVTAGADAIIVYFDGVNLDEANNACHHMLAAIDAQRNQWSWLKECVPSYDSLLVVFDMALIDSHGVYQALHALSDTSEFARSKGANSVNSVEGTSAVIEIPVWYGAPHASDLSVVSKKTSLSIDEIIELHTSVTYKVYAVGFAPGFAYMGDIPEAMNCARLGTPRKRVPKGAVAIADRQTAVYPSESPGGWNLLGITSFDMLLHSEEHSESRLKAGDIVKFVSITGQEYRSHYES